MREVHRSDLLGYTYVLVLTAKDVSRGIYTEGQGKASVSILTTRGLFADVYISR